ncbi:MAG: Serine/threonine-protein kinase PknA, partial [uncultured Frankineae bacterium]
MSTPAGVVDGLLAGRYQLASRLAAGGMGEVWRARDLLLDRDVAVKTLRAELADDDDVRARFRAEARHAGRLSSPGIASVYDFGEADGVAWLVLELVDGESLASVLRREGRLGTDRTLDVVAQTAAALQAAHDAEVVHRDVKPGNLLVRPDGVVKVTDFGIASAAGAAHLTRTGQVVGTAGYLAPEQADGRAATAATDLYSLGVVAHECLAGTHPFPFDNPIAVLLAHLQTPPPELPADVPAPVADLVSRLLAKDPADRPTSARLVAAEAQALRRRGSSASPTPVAPRPEPAAPTSRTAPLPVLRP